MAILVTRLATAVRRKTPKMAINRNFPGLIFSKCCERPKRRARNSASRCSKFAENARSPGKLRFIAILGVFRLETAVASRVTKMAITRFRGSKTRGTFDHRMRKFLLFVFVSRNIC